MANALARQEKYDQAIAEYRTALELKPSSPVTHYNLGLVLASTGKLEEAVHHFRRVLEINRTPRGQPEMFADDLGKYDDAIARLSKKLRAEPGDVTARYALGFLYAQQGMLEEAIHHLSLVAESEAAARAREARKEQEPAARIARYRTMVQNEPNNADAHFYLANALSDSGNKEEAIPEYRKAISIRPDFAAAHNNLAVALYSTAQYSEAWREVHLCRKHGGQVHPGFLKSLSEKMPDPGPP